MIELKLMDRVFWQVKTFDPPFEPALGDCRRRWS